MYGWRARLGIVIPSLNAVSEPEFCRIAPEGVTSHFQRFSFTGGGIETLKNLRNLITDAVEQLLHIYPSAIGMCCTAGSFAGGKGWDQGIIKEIQDKADLPATTASTAVLEAFRKMGVHTVSMAVPYLEEIAIREKEFFEDNDIEVANMKWLNKDGFEMYEVPYETTYRLAMQVNSQKAQAIFISCVALPTAGLISKLENDVGKPVITSNQAFIWHLLRLATINEKIEGFGSLLSL